MPGRVLFSIAVLAVATGAQAVEREPDDHTLHFECDTPAGQYSNWSTTTHAAAVVITGTLSADELRLEKRWSSVVSVFLSGGAEHKTTHGFRAFDPDKKRKQLDVGLYIDGRDEALARKAIRVGADPVPFRVELTATGTLRVRVGDKERSADVGRFSPTMIELSCSTGAFTFADVRIDETPHEPSR